MNRRDYQRSGDRFIKQMRDPSTGKRVRIVASSPEQLFAVVAAKRDLGARLKHGIATPGDVALMQSLGRGPLLVRDAWAEYLPTLRAGWARIAPSVYKHRLAPYFADLPCAELGDAKLEAWAVAELKKGLAPKTIEVAWFGLRAAVRLQVQAGKLARLPWDRFKAPKDGRDLFDRREVARSFEEILSIVRAASVLDARMRARHPIVADLAVRLLVMFYLGLRQGELSALGWDDLDLECSPPLQPSVRVRHQVLLRWRARHPEWERPSDHVKGKHVLTTLLHPTAVELLLAHRERLRALAAYRADGPVFPEADGGWRRHPCSIRNERFRKLIRAAGLPHPDGWTVHSIRHSTATLEMVGSGFNIQHVQRRLRHANASTTWGYAHLLQRGAVPSALPTLASSGSTAPGPPLLPAPLPLLEPGEIERCVALSKPPPGVPGRRRERLSFREAWAAWVGELGSEEAARSLFLAAPETRPAIVTELADRAYRRLYNRELHAGGDRAKARRLGNEARRNTIAAWVRFARRQ